MSCIGAFQSIASCPSSSSFRAAQTDTRKSAGSGLLPLAIMRIHSLNHNTSIRAQNHKFGYGLRSRTNTRSYRCLSALTPELKTTLDKVVTSHKVILFMKGTKDFPQCGFSNTVVQILKSMNVPFETMNILENEIVRQGLKEYSSWPTFPQLYIDGEFFGGCDITVGLMKEEFVFFLPEAYKSGELQELLEKAMCS